MRCNREGVETYNKWKRGGRENHSKEKERNDMQLILRPLITSLPYLLFGLSAFMFLDFCF